MQAVVETPPYLADAIRLFTEQERATLSIKVAADPRRGVVVPGSGGIRKFRFGFSARGKRGGARIIYLFGGQDVPIFLLAVFAKNEKADLTAAERNTSGKQVAAILADYRRR